jgi:hypothetical protein
MNCPACGELFTVRSANDAPAEDAPGPLDPGWRKVAVGYRMLRFALWLLLLGAVASVGVTVGAWALYAQKVVQDAAVPQVAGNVVGGTFALGVAVFALLGHLFFLAMPSDENGGKGKQLALTMLVVGIMPGFNVIVPLLLLPVFSAGVGTALGDRRLTQSGWLLYTWYAAAGLALPMLAYLLVIAGASLGMPVVGGIVAGWFALVGWVLVLVALDRTFAGFRRGIEDALRERGTRG